MSKGNINISTENIFPIIKKFLYSDHEIFLRELISNATDATLKHKHLLSIGEAKGDFGNPIIEIKIDKKKKTLHIIDQGIGMTEEEVKKYINEIAFSGAEEFVNKYKDKLGETGIIGHFGLGFYSAFMVSEKVTAVRNTLWNPPKKQNAVQKSYSTLTKIPKSFWKNLASTNCCVNTIALCRFRSNTEQKRNM